MSEITNTDSKSTSTTEAKPEVKSENSTTEGIALVSFKDFTKIALRVGVIESAEKIEKSEKLLKLQVNLGEDIGKKQIIAGISKFYEPETLLNKRVAVVSNLAPAKLMGQLSEGMILAASNDKGDLELISLSETFQGGDIIR